jgi:hypothetical protein
MISRLNGPNAKNRTLLVLNCRLPHINETDHKNGRIQSSGAHRIFASPLQRVSVGIPSKSGRMKEEEPTGRDFFLKDRSVFNLLQVTGQKHRRRFGLLRHFAAG